MTVTEKAAKEVLRICEEQNIAVDKIYLRVAIKGGGCAGYKTDLNLDENFDENKDILIEDNGIKIAVDKRSNLYLKNAKVDFSDGLNHRGFVVDVPESTGKCGCNGSFSM